MPGIIGKLIGKSPTVVCCAPRSILPVSVVILETERGCCGDCAGDYRGSGCGGNGCKSKSFSLNLSTSTFMLKVNFSGVVGRRASYNQYKKAPDQSPHADASGFLHASQLQSRSYRNHPFSFRLLAFRAFALVTFALVYVMRQAF